jgi:hypothetical protein
VLDEVVKEGNGKNGFTEHQDMVCEPGLTVVTITRYLVLRLPDNASIVFRIAEELIEEPDIVDAVISLK